MEDVGGWCWVVGGGMLRTEVWMGPVVHQWSSSELEVLSFLELVCL